MAFYTDQVITGVSSTAPIIGGSTSLSPPPLFPVTPANEVQNFQGSLYYYSDCIENESHYVGALTVSGVGALKIPFSTGVVTPAGNYSNAFYTTRPGVMFIHATTATTGSVAVGSSTQQGNNQNEAIAIFPNGPKVIANIVFFTPTSSSATDSYSFLIGNLVGIAGVADLANNGVGIHYTHSSNGGNWNLKEFSNGAVATLANSTVPFVPLTWHKLVITYNNTPNTITCQLIQAGSTTIQTIATTVSSTFLSGGRPLLLGGAGMTIRRTTVAAPTTPIAPLIDYWSLGVNPTGRQW